LDRKYRTIAEMNDRQKKNSSLIAQIIKPMIIRSLLDRRYRNLRNLRLAIPCGIVAPQSGAERREPAAFVAFAEDDTQLSDISCLHWQSVTIRAPSLYRREYGYLGRRVRGGF